ncbi:MAG TPA: hypothetical protein PLF22_03750 [Pseudomonadales bacterium]|nr:hypothetical protein [Pseudomonadales bacterium]
MANPHAPQQSSNTETDKDGSADAFAAVAIIAVVVSTVVYWLHGMA